MNYFDDDVETALELIAEAGADCLWIKPAAVDPDNPKPWRSDSLEQPVEHPVKMVFLSAKDLGYGSGSGSTPVSGTEVPENDKIGLMGGGQAFTPEIGDTIGYFNGMAEILKIDILQPNGLPILYYVWIKR